MKLQTLLQDWVLLAEDRDISGLALDSQQVLLGDGFIALAGSKQHGLLYAEQAIANGAQAIIYDPMDNGTALANKITSVPTIAIPDLGLRLGDIASRFYNHPSYAMDVIGITGTNGKTSCSHFLSHILEGCAIIGTLGWGELGKLCETRNTTPDALSVQRMLFELVKQGKKTVAMEVSSHALVQGRVNGVRFKGVIFTNISRDHLDYHGSMESYLHAKLTLLDKPGIGFVVVNLDDPYAHRIIAKIPPLATAWGISTSDNVQPNMECLGVKEVSHNAEGISFVVQWGSASQAIQVPLYGDFNIENTLSVLAVALAMGDSLATAANKLQLIQAVSGRMEPLGGGLLPLVFVDYAHTPDALNKVLASVRKHCQGTLWVVFGCGGNRDSGKRPEMGQIAEQWADRVIITDDNPRFETSEAIISDIRRGCQSHKIEVIPDREKAIQAAVLNAAAQDCIVVAGKGHEAYQEKQGVRLPFSDKQVVMEVLNRRIIEL